MPARPVVLEFGMGVDVHGEDGTKVPEPASVDLERVRRELPHGEVTVRAVSGGLRVPDSDTLIACAAITVSVEDPG
jgi:hypothetical protein